MPYPQPILADWNALGSGSSPSMTGAQTITTGPGLTGSVAFSGLTYLTADEADDPGEGMFQVLQGSLERYRQLTGAQKSKWVVDRQVQASPLSSGFERHTFFVVFERSKQTGGETNPGN